MYCRNCGEKLAENTNFCSSCGAKVRNGEEKLAEPKAKKTEPSINQDFKVEEDDKIKKARQEDKSKEKVELAGFWIRVIAQILDGIIMGIPIFIIILIIETIAPGIGSILSYFVYPIATILFWVNWNGQTPGKRILNLRIISNNYNKTTLGTAVLRYVGYVFSFIIIGIGYIMVGFHSEKKGLHDLIANTYVIREK